MQLFSKQRWVGYVTALGLVVAVLNASAWSAKGHVLITEMALQRMTTAQRQQLQHYADVLTDALPVLLQQQLEDAYPGASLFSKLSPLPDRWREYSLAQLFASLDAPLPAPLQPYRDQTTQSWHFIDQPYPANPRCELAHSGDIIHALDLLQQAWQSTTNDKSRAILLVLMTHFVEDAHQPLHMLSRTTRTCRQDAGGNKRLLMVGRYRPINLHQWWDSAGGYLTHRLQFTQQATSLRERYDHTYPSAQATNLNLADWAEEAYGLAPFIYSTPSNRLMSNRYAMRSQALACQRLTLASKRLDAWLTRLALVPSP